MEMNNRELDKIKLRRIDSLKISIVKRFLEEKKNLNTLTNEFLRACWLLEFQMSLKM